MTAVTFKTLPKGALKPGFYGEINTTTGVSGLPVNTQLLLMIGQKVAAGSQASGAAVQIYSAADAATYFGAGSVLHRMALRAFAVSTSIPVWAIAQDDAATSAAATATLTIGGTAATAAGTLSVNLGNDIVQVGVQVGDTPTALAARALTQISAQTAWAATAAVAAGVITFTAKNKGTVGNQLSLAATLTDVVGLTAAVVDFSGGTVDPTLQPTLDAVYNKRFHVVAMQSATAADLATLKTHLAGVSSAVEQRGARGYVGITKGILLADVITLATGVNQELVHVLYGPGSVSTGYEVAATAAAIVAAQDDPAVPFDGVKLPGVALPPIASRLSRSQQESLLSSGVTPLEVVDGNLTIVRLVTTRTLTSGTQDLTLLDTNTMAILFYYRDAVKARYVLKYQQAKLNARTLAGLRAEALAVAYELQDAEILQEIDAYKDQFTAALDPDMVGRAVLAIPAPIVPGLHQAYARIDLLTV